MGMGMGVNPYPPAYMGNPVGLFLCRGYGYGVVIPGGYLPIAISNLDEIGEEQAPCIALRNMSIGNVCRKELE